MPCYDIDRSKYNTNAIRNTCCLITDTKHILTTIRDAIIQHELTLLALVDDAEAIGSVDATICQRIDNSVMVLMNTICGVLDMTRCHRSGLGQTIMTPANTSCTPAVIIAGDSCADSCVTPCTPIAVCKEIVIDQLMIYVNNTNLRITTPLSVMIKCNKEENMLIICEDSCMFAMCDDFINKYSEICNTICNSGVPTNDGLSVQEFAIGVELELKKYAICKAKLNILIDRLNQACSKIRYQVKHYNIDADVDKYCKCPEPTESDCCCK